MADISQLQKLINDLGAIQLNNTFLDAAVSNAAVATERLTDVNVADAALFDLTRYAESGDSTHLPISYFVKEASLISRMRDLVQVGKGLKSRLYAYRSCSRAIPQGTSQDADRRQELNIKIYELLRPEVEKMIDFMTFRDAAIVLVTDVFCAVVKESADYDVIPSSYFFNQFAEILDMFVVMDAMKNIKGSMNNDFSLTMPNLPKNYIVEDQTIQYHRLYLFLGQQDQFGVELKKSIQEKCKHADDIIVGFLNFVTDALEDKASLSLPETRHSFVRSLAFALFLLDDLGEEKDINKRKKLKIDKFGKFFKAMPVVPLLGDMPLLLSNIYGKAPHINASRWDISNDPDAKESLRKTFSLAEHIDTLRESFGNHLSQLLLFYTSDHHTVAKNELPPAKLFESVHESLKFLSSLTKAISEQSAWKFWNPASANTNKNIPENAIAYELVVKYNYTDTEKAALIEAISMVKVMASALDGLSRNINNVLQAYIRNTIGGFISVAVPEIISYTAKKKKGLSTVFRAVRSFGLEKDDAEDKKEKHLKGAPLPRIASEDIANRKSGFSNTQLYFISALLEYAVSEKTKSSRGLLKEKELKDSHVQDIQAFIQKLETFRYFGDLKGTIASCSNLSGLWFKEFYLELSRQVQFPISMSLPWILIEHILKSHDPTLVRCLFSPLDLYNDAGIFALTSLKSRYIYDEITAEELESLIKCLKKSHELLSERLDLDCFDDIFAEVNESLSLTQNNGRILTHIRQELINDVIPNFCYESSTNRFTRSSMSFIESIRRSGFAKAPTMYLYGSKSLSVAFITQNSVFRNFVGDPHFQAILRLCSYHALPILSGEILAHLSMLITHTMTAYINVIQKGTPQSMRLPLFEYGTEGTYEYFLAHLKPLVTYKDLQPEVLQAFREVGNAVLLIRCLDEALKIDVGFYNHFIGGVLSKVNAGTKIPVTWEERASIDLQNSKAVSESFVSNFLAELSTSLGRVSEEWREQEGKPLMQNPKAFYRIWSAVQFAFSVPTAAVGKGEALEKSNLKMFGDGLCWGGGTFVCLLDQIGLFNAFDFNQHIWSVFKSEKRSGVFGADSDVLDSNSTLNSSNSSLGSGTLSPLSNLAIRPDLAQFLEHVRTTQSLNEEIFSFLTNVK
ncbi:Cytoplasmic FMR1-interacting protein 2 [Phlyctochytrium planicorne]|nr:Cytoplasmic FMR1-interacting protein 2 [Phlyctochytrium planicorne]